MFKPLSFAVITTILLSSGCAWVKTTPDGEKVRVLDQDEVSTCMELGTTTASLIDKVVGIDRSRQKVEKELQTLARNSAAKIGGDTVVPISEARDGQQRFAVYKCVGVSR